MAGVGTTTGRTRGGDTHGGDTRARIRRIALELFAEQGYERTSLREIAERLGVTKAALYYHFKSKEDIVLSLTEDYFAEFDELIAWAREQPPGVSTRLAIVERYMDIVERGSEVFRFLERNQAAMRGMEEGKHRLEQFRPRFSALVEEMAGADAPLRSRLHAMMALMTVNFGLMFFGHDTPDPCHAPAPADPDELRTAVLEIATDLAHQAGS